MSRYTVTGRDWSRPHTDTGNRLRAVSRLPMARERSVLMRATIADWSVGFATVMLILWLVL
jgi:hypothetical protein